MIKTVGVCGYVSTGSSAFIDLLYEFDETQVLNKELLFIHLPDGLEDLDYRLKKASRYSSPVAIKRFRKLMNIYMPEEIGTGDITNEFLNKIIQYSFKGSSNISDIYSCSPLVRRIIRIVKNTRLKIPFRKKIEKLLHPRLDFSILPSNFDEASKVFISDILRNMGIDYCNKEKEVIVLNQAFDARDPIAGFKYFENPIAIIVDRDPRDHYLFCKKYLKTTVIPCHSIDDYIKHYRLVRQSAQSLWGKEVIRFNFEELVYDCENTVKKVSGFVGINKRVRKGECFKPSHSRNNTQLFKKYSGYESDIKKIEQELPEYIFPFEKYPDIEPEGKMFFGSQINKKYKSDS